MPRRPTNNRDRQQRLQDRPLAIRKIPSPHTEIITAQGMTQQPLLKHGLVSRCLFDGDCRFLAHGGDDGDHEFLA
jgi:hypothetical protein